MSFVSTISMLLLVLMMTGGQVLFKIAANNLKLPDSTNFSVVAWLRVITEPYLVCAVLLYGAATFLWVLILRDAELSRAYPFVALTLVLVPLCGVVFLDEQFSWALAGGGLLILMGVAVIALFA